MRKLQFINEVYWIPSGEKITYFLKLAKNQENKILQKIVNEVKIQLNSVFESIEHIKSMAFEW